MVIMTGHSRGYFQILSMVIMTGHSRGYLQILSMVIMSGHSRGYFLNSINGYNEWTF